MSILKSVFGFGKRTEKIKEMLNNGAVIVDVRSQAEFAGGSVKGALNYPLPGIANKADALKKMNKPVILCCASGMRSGQATSILKSDGIDCMNAGSWHSLDAIMNQK